jgi:catechol 2,3-dioxygenase-like lactoylglutathione lyase family enzyme
MTGIVGLGHVVLAAEDPQAISSFYTDVLGLELVETDRDYSLTFLSSRPGEVNHDLSFTKYAKMAHIAYEVDSLQTLRRFHAELQRRGVKIITVMNFGWSIGMTFLDPEGNRCELFWKTGRALPHRAPIDITLPDNEIERILDATAAKAETS